MASLHANHFVSLGAHVVGGARVWVNARGHANESARDICQQDAYSCGAIIGRTIAPLMAHTRGRTRGNPQVQWRGSPCATPGVHGGVHLSG